MKIALNLDVSVRASEVNGAIGRVIDHALTDEESRQGVDFTVR